MKLFVVLFAFLAVQASARFIDEADIQRDTLDFTESSDFAELEIFGHLHGAIFDTFAGKQATSNPENCLPYVKDAYNTAVEVGRIVRKAEEIHNKFTPELEKCKKQTYPSDIRKCFQDVWGQAITEVKPLKDAFLAVQPKVIDSMGKFDICMGDQSEEHAIDTDARKCLPHIQEAYNTAVEVRRFVVKVQELGEKLKESFKKCGELSDPNDKIKCFEDLQKQAIAEGKPIREGYLKIRPKVVEVMSKFDQCMA